MFSELFGIDKPIKEDMEHFVERLGGQKGRGEMIQSYYNHRNKKKSKSTKAAFVTFRIKQSVSLQ